MLLLPLSGLSTEPSSSDAGNFTHILPAGSSVAHPTINFLNPVTVFLLAVSFPLSQSSFLENLHPHWSILNMCCWSAIQAHPQYHIHTVLLFEWHPHLNARLNAPNYRSDCVQKISTKFLWVQFSTEYRSYSKILIFK